jgi:glucuronate isomerase
MSRELVSRHKKTGQYKKYVEPDRYIDMTEHKRINNELQKILNVIDNRERLHSIVLYTSKIEYFKYRYNELDIKCVFDNIRYLKRQLKQYNDRIILDKQDLVNENDIFYIDVLQKYITSNNQNINMIKKIILV